MKKTMDFTGKCLHQGDVQMFEITAVPSNAKRIEKQFIAASERTGSFHALFGNYDQYEVDGGFVIDAKEKCILNHSLKEHLLGVTMDEVKELPKKDHRFTEINPGVYFFGIQNKFNPLQGFFERVRD